MQQKKIPPRIAPLNATEYVVFSWENGWYNVAYYRPYKVGEDGIREEDAKKIHKRFAIRKKSLLDCLRVILGEGNSDESPDIVESYIRKTFNYPALPGDPGEAHRVPTEETTENSAAS